MAWKSTVAAAVACCFWAFNGCLATAQSPAYEKTQFQLLVSSETMGGVGGRLTSEQETEQEVERLLSLRPASAAPRKVVLHEVPSSARTVINSAQKWMELRQATSETMKRALEGTGVFQQVEFLPEVLLPGAAAQDLKTLRIACARAQADGVLVYSTEAGYESKPNGWAILYPTVVGAFSAPGTDLSSMVIAKAVLLDARTGYIYLLSETYASGSARVSASNAPRKWEELEFDVRKRAVTDLAGVVAAKVGILKGAPQGE